MWAGSHMAPYSILQCSNAEQHERNQQFARHWEMPPSRCHAARAAFGRIVAILAQSRLAGRLLEFYVREIGCRDRPFEPSPFAGLRCCATTRALRSGGSPGGGELPSAPRANSGRSGPRLLLSARASRSRISARARDGSRRSLCQSSAMIGSSKRSSSPGSWRAAYGEWVSPVSCDQSRSSRAAEAERC